MRDVLPTLLSWKEEGRRFALATVVQTWGSSPRPIGSVMGVTADGAVVGSVSGGCVESAVIEAATRALTTGEPKMLDFGELSDASVWEVGLSCGGRIRVWVDPLFGESEAWTQAVECVRRDEAAVLVTAYDPPGRTLWTTAEANDSPLDPLARAALLSRTSVEVEVEGQTYFLHALPCRERLLIIGAVHVAIPLVSFARDLGFEVIVIDPRGSLATAERFAIPPDSMVVDWPQRALADLGITEETYAVLLTHDPKIDNEALTVLLRSPARYIGALGSHTTHEKRLRQLRDLGFSEDEVARIHGPVGLKIGARSPEEIAISILAEIVQVRRAKR